MSVPSLEIYVKGTDEPVFQHTLSPHTKDAERIEAAVRRIHPELWGGMFVHER